ncbi:MAG: BON domain-containing protein [Aggregatilineales bacterium]
MIDAPTTVRQPSERDMELQEIVNERLESDSVVRELDIPLETEVLDGVVTVTGVARSRMTRERILYLVASTPGVKKVIDNLVTDPEIETEIARLVAADPSIRPRLFKVSSYMARVTLYGEVESEEERQAILTLARSVAGVRDILDYLTVSPTT